MNSNYNLLNEKYPFYNVNGFETLEYQKDTTTLVNVLSASMRASLKNVVFPTKITSYATGVFEDCSNLKIEMAITESISSIGNNAFKNSAITFTSVDLSGCSSYPSVGTNAFTGTTVKKLIVNDNGVKVNSNYGISSEFYPFYGVKGFTTLEYKEGKTFAYNVLSSSMRKTLTEVTVSSSVTQIGSSAFDDCVLLERISLPWAAKYDREKTFRNCKAVITYY